MEAQAEAPFVFSGARAGVDGTYRISSRTHRADRGGGSITELQIKQPEGGAGKDTRRPTEGAGAPGDPRTRQEAPATPEGPNWQEPFDQL